MEKEELKIIKRAIKDYLKTLKIDEMCPYDSEGKEFSDKKYKSVVREISVCKKLLKDK